MRIPRTREIARCARAIALFFLVACGGDKSSPTVVPPPTPATPVIASISPSELTISSTAQTLTIGGSNFSSPTLIVASPSGTQTRFTGAQLANASANGFSVSIVLSTAGTWQASVQNASGTTSASLAFTVIPLPAPQITSVSPTRVLGDGTSTITVNGSGFQPGLSVVFARDVASEVVVPSASITGFTDHSFSFRSPVIANSATLNLYVANPDGQWSAGAPIAFGPQVVSPTITSLLPATIGVATVGQVITIAGSGISDTPTITLTAPDGSTRVFAGPQIFVPQAGMLQIFTVLTTQGTWTLRVSNPDLGHADKSFTVGAALPDQTLPPVITTFSPAGPSTSDAEQTVTLQGSNFQTGVTATFVASATNATISGRVISVTPTTVQIGVVLARSGLWSVSVRNPDGAPSNAVQFQVNLTPPLATTTITSATPITTSLSEQVVTLTGTGFRESLVATATRPSADLNVPTNGVIRATFISTTQAELRGVFDRAGTWKVGVVGATPVDLVVSYPNSVAPVIDGLDPAQPYASTLTQVVHITGSGFQVGARVLSVGDDSVRQISPTNMVVDSVTATSLRLTGALSKPGRVQVQNPDGRVSNVFRFAEQAPPPSLVAVGGALYVSTSPATIRVPAHYVQSDAVITLLNPAGDARTVSNVAIVTGPSGSVTLSAVFDTAGQWTLSAANLDGKKSGDLSIRVYAAAAPVVTGTSPSSPQAQHDAQPITIQGTGFVAGLQVTLRFSGTQSIVQTLSGSQIQNLTATSFQVPAQLFIGGRWSIAVVNPDGQEGDFDRLTVTGTASAPTVRSVAPALTSGTIQAVTVTGSGFHLPMTVTVTAPNGQPELTNVGVTNLTLTSFQFAYKFGQTGTWTISVTNADGQRSNVLQFTVK